MSRIVSIIASMSTLILIGAACGLARQRSRRSLASPADAFQAQERLLIGLLVLAGLAIGAFVSVLVWNKIM